MSVFLGLIIGAFSVACVTIVFHVSKALMEEVRSYRAAPPNRLGTKADAERERWKRRSN